MGKVWDVNYRSTKRKSQFLGSLVQSARLSHIVFHMTGARPPSIAEENMEKARPLRLLMRRAFHRLHLTFLSHCTHTKSVRNIQKPWENRNRTKSGEYKRPKKRTIAWLPFRTVLKYRFWCFNYCCGRIFGWKFAFFPDSSITNANIFLGERPLIGINISLIRCGRPDANKLSGKTGIFPHSFSPPGINNKKNSTVSIQTYILNNNNGNNNTVKGSSLFDRWG